MRWSGWLNLGELQASKWKGLPTSPGLYWLAAVDGSQSRPLVRVVRTDGEGTIYIGRSMSSIRGRIKTFWKCATDAMEEGHIAGWRYARSSLRRRFPLQCLAVSYLKLPESKVMREEAENLHWYWNRFGELPPLNFSLPWLKN